jgi:hypothetical protein
MPGRLSPFKTDDKDIARVDLAAKNRLRYFFLAVKHAGRAFMPHHFRQNGALFDDTSLRRQVALRIARPPSWE